MLDSTLEQSEALTVARFDRTQDRVVRDFGYGDTKGALAIAEDNLKKLSGAIAARLVDPDELKDAEKRDFYHVIRNLDPNVIALAALSTCLHGVAIGTAELKLIKSLGGALAGELWAHGLLEHNGKLARRIEKAVKERHGNLKYRRQAARSIATRAGYKQKHWSVDQLVKAGSWMLGVVVETLPDVFERVQDEEGKPYLTVSSAAMSVAEAAVEQAIKNNPMFLPSTEKPLPWTGWKAGGYWDERTRLNTDIVRTFYKETAANVRGAMRDGAMRPHVDALNALQSVAFRINKPVLDTLLQCYDQGVVVEGLPSKDDVAMPGRPFAWAHMTEDQKKVWKQEAGQIKEHNRTLLGTRLMFKQDCETAEQLTKHERFYTPLNCDWRGRVYGVPHFNFQRDDRVRALFLFAEGEPLGEEGLRWLKIHVANCGDFDKISKQPLDARVAWTEANLEKIFQCADHPLSASALSIWTSADKPFLFLAACMELALAVRSPSPTNFITHLPVSFDGSCSGLQHLCAMTRAPEGSLVNLTPSPTPQDVYQTVSERVTQAVQADAVTGKELAKLALAFGITRKVVKRNVMTYSYSSKKFGMAKQQDEDLIQPLAFAVLSGKLAEHPFGRYAVKPHPYAASPAAVYLAEKTYEAIKQIVDGPERAMQLLRKTARALAHERKPVSWTTPTGLPWANRYYEPQVKRIALWLHDTRVRVSVADGTMKTIDKEKAANGVAPNFVHALDAAHLALTVDASVAEGITQIATVHDSFGCLASRATRFNQIIREQFVKMYEEHDVLNEVLQRAKCDLTVHNQQRLPEGLQYGSLNLRGVLQAPYAFA